MGRATLSKSLIQRSVDRQGCVHSLLCDLRPNYGGGNEDSGGLLQKAPCTHCSVAPGLHKTTTDPRLCWRLLDPPGQVWVGLLWGRCSFLLGPGAHKVCLCLPRVCFPVLCKFWQLYGGLMVTSSKRAYATPRSAAPRAHATATVHC